MIAENLGETIDIHGGGLDLVFPHHENESAQSRSAHAGSLLARYWLHNGFLTLTDTAAGVGKMSKSLGNVVSVGELLERGHGGETLRLALLSAHYRQPLEWNEAQLSRTKTILDRLYRRLKMFSFIDDEELGIDDCNQAVVDALADDLNTPLALSKLVAIDDPKWTCPAKLESSSEGRRSISWASRNAGPGRNSRLRPFVWRQALSHDHDWLVGLNP